MEWEWYWYLLIGIVIFIFGVLVGRANAKAVESVVDAEKTIVDKTGKVISVVKS